MAKMLFNAPVKPEADNNATIEPTAKPAEKAAVKEAREKEQERDALASGLPEWNVEPPAVVVRRRARAI